MTTLLQRFFVPLLVTVALAGMITAAIARQSGGTPSGGTGPAGLEGCPNCSDCCDSDSHINGFKACIAEEDRYGNCLKCATDGARCYYIPPIVLLPL